MDSNVKKVMEEIKANIHGSLQKFSFDLDEPVVAREFKERVIKYLEYLADKRDKAWKEHFKLDFLIENEHNIVITPGNLFTFLSLHGFFVDPVHLEGRDRYETEIGTFVFEDGEALFIPKKAAEYVQIDLVLGKDKEET